MVFWRESTAGRGPSTSTCWGRKSLRKVRAALRANLLSIGNMAEQNQQELEDRLREAEYQLQEFKREAQLNEMRTKLQVKELKQQKTRLETGRAEMQSRLGLLEEARKQLEGKLAGMAAELVKVHSRLDQSTCQLAAKDEQLMRLREFAPGEHLLREGETLLGYEQLLQRSKSLESELNQSKAEVQLLKKEVIDQVLLKEEQIAGLEEKLDQQRCRIEDIFQSCKAAEEDKIRAEELLQQTQAECGRLLRQKQMLGERLEQMARAVEKGEQRLVRAEEERESALAITQKHYEELARASSRSHQGMLTQLQQSTTHRIEGLIASLEDSERIMNQQQEEAAELRAELGQTREQLRGAELELRRQARAAEEQKRQLEIELEGVQIALRESRIGQQPDAGGEKAVLTAELRLRVSALNRQVLELTQQNHQLRSQLLAKTALVAKAEDDIVALGVRGDSRARTSQLCRELLEVEQKLVGMCARQLALQMELSHKNQQIRHLKSWASQGQATRPERKAVLLNYELQVGVARRNKEVQSSRLSAREYNSQTQGTVRGEAGVQTRKPFCSAVRTIREGVDLGLLKLSCGVQAAGQCVEEGVQSTTEMREEGSQCQQGRVSVQSQTRGSRKQDRLGLGRNLSCIALKNRSKTSLLQSSFLSIAEL